MSKLRKVTLHAARSKAFPDGSARHGYEFVAPLTEAGKIDAEAWRSHRGECFARRFWGDDGDERGLLVHRPGGRGGASWGFEFGEALDEAESGFRFADHAFLPGEYVSAPDPEGELTTFKVVSVS
jgi:hypothetical protein